MAKNPNAMGGVEVIGDIDAIVVLGKNLDDDGSPKDELRQRVARGVEIYRWCANLAGSKAPPLLIMSGDYSASAKVRPPRTEAAVMDELALELGTPASAVRQESKSLCTWGNALFTGRITRQHDLKRLVVVTSDYHWEASGVHAFSHTLGNDHEITSVVIETPELSPEQIAYKVSAARMAEEIINNTMAGDILGIQAKLASMVSAYAELFTDLTHQTELTDLIGPFRQAGGIIMDGWNSP